MIETLKRITSSLPLVLITTALLALLISGCKEDPISETGAITIRANKKILIADGNDIVTFTVTDSDNKDITSNCLFFVDGNQLVGNSYTTTLEGVQICSAEYDNVKSNNLVIESRAKYKFKTDKSIIVADGIDRAVITIIDYLNVSRTNQATIYINDQPISGNTFATTVTGVYTLKATIDGYSFTKEISAASTVKFNSRVLIEDYTGAWCGYCPRMTTAIEKAMAGNSDILIMAIHNGDIMATPYEATLRSRYNITGFPSARVNRTMPWDENASSLVQFFKTDIPFGVAISSSVTGSNLSAEVNIRFNSPPGEKIKVAAFIIEDNIIASQSNFYSDGRGNPIPGFVHSAVLREKLSESLLGDPVNTDGVSTGSVITVNFSKALNSAWKPENCKILVLIVKDSNDQVITGQEAAIGSGVGY